MNTCPECGNEHAGLSRKLCPNCTATKHFDKYRKTSNDKAGIVFSKE